VFTSELQKGEECPQLRGIEASIYGEQDDIVSLRDLSLRDPPDQDPVTRLVAKHLGGIVEVNISLVDIPLTRCR
jgi:hypothetical protein